MKVVAFISLATCANAFVLPVAPATGMRTSATRMMAGELKAAEAEAKKLTEQFGKTSPQAAAAWDAFEEVAAADNSITTRPGLDEACEVERLEICAEYEQQMAELEKILSGADASSGMSVRQLAESNKKLIEENSRLRKSLGTYK